MMRSEWGRRAVAAELIDLKATNCTKFNATIDNDWFSVAAAAVVGRACCRSGVPSSWYFTICHAKHTLFFSLNHQNIIDWIKITNFPFHHRKWKVGLDKQHSQRFFYLENIEMLLRNWFIEFSNYFARCMMCVCVTLSWGCLYKRWNSCWNCIHFQANIIIRCHEFNCCFIIISSFFFFLHRLASAYRRMKSHFVGMCMT